MLSTLMIMTDSDEERKKIEELYDTYQGLMYAVAYRILNHPQNAEDAVFTSWEKIIRHLDKIFDIQSRETKSFILIVVERTAIDMYRKLKCSKEIPLDVEESPYYAVRDISLEEVETVQWIHSLPKKYAEVALLYYINGYTLKEIGDILSLSEGTVSRRLQKARKILQKWNEL